MPSRPSPRKGRKLTPAQCATLKEGRQKSQQLRLLLTELIQESNCPLKNENFWTKISDAERHQVGLAIQKAERKILTDGLQALNKILQEKKTNRQL